MELIETLVNFVFNLKIKIFSSVENSFDSCIRFYCKFSVVSLFKLVSYLNL